MKKLTYKVAHKDDRGTIADLVTSRFHTDAISVVSTKKGAVRGNHFHAKTAQWAYVLSGRLFVTNGLDEFELGPGEGVFDPPGDPHAWRAIEDTVCVVFVQGPRAGDNYESDTYRLKTPLIVP